MNLLEIKVQKKLKHFSWATVFGCKQIALFARPYTYAVVQRRLEIKPKLKLHHN